VRPEINSEDTAYKLYVPSDLTEINITPVTQDINATATSMPVTLREGQETEIPITVTASDGTTKKYVFDITRVNKTTEEVKAEMAQPGYVSFVDGERFYEQPVFAVTVGAVAGGLIVTLIYNLEANILRALGDSIVPLIILVISAVLNVGLDFLFIFGFGMGVDGAALATVIAQLISAIVCFVYLIRKCPFLKLGRSDFRLHGEEIKSLLASGLGMALMYSIVDIGSIVLQNGINGLGTDIISAHTAARKIFSFTIMPFSAISATLVTFVSQNLGAGKFDRIKKSIKYGLLIGYGWSTLAVLIVYLFGEQLVLMIAPADNREIIDTAVNYLRINVPFYYALNTLLSLRCTLQGLGKSVVPIGASIVEMIWKIVTVVAVIPVCGYFGVCISEPIIWTASGLLVAVIAIKTLRAFEKA